MTRLIRYLLWGDAHIHKWVILESSELKCNSYYRGELYIMQCSVCGNIKKKRIYPE